MKIIKILYIIIVLVFIITCAKDEPVIIEPEIVVEEIIEDCYFITTISTFSQPRTEYGIETFLINNRWIDGESNIILIDSCGINYKVRIAVLEFEKLN